MKKTVYITLSVMILVSCFSLGFVSGYARGTGVSALTARSDMVASKAVTLATSLDIHYLEDEETKEVIISMYDNMITDSLEEYYKYRDVELFLYDPLRRFNLFELLTFTDFDVVREYILEHKSQDEIDNTPVYLRLLNDDEN